MDFVQNCTSTLAVAMAACCLVLILMLCKSSRRPKNFPPGPRGIPILGCLPFVGKSAPKTYQKWSKTYGPLMSARLGKRDWILLNDYESIYEALEKNKDSLSGRPTIPLFKEVSGGHGIAFLDYGNFWRSQRIFGAKMLAGHGVGKRSLEEKVQDEATYLIRAIQSEKGLPFYPEVHTTNAAANCVCCVIFGKRFNYSDQRFRDVILELSKIFNSSEYVLMVKLSVFLPFLSDLPPFSWTKAKVMRRVKKVIDNLTELISEAKENFDSKNLRHFIDAYVAEMKKDGSSYFTDQQLLHFVRILCVAGIQTISSMIRWAVLVMLNCPETQEKMHQEISRVMGPNRKCGMDNQSELPYTCAFVEELYRYHAAAPLSLPHKATADTMLKGFFIPKDTRIAENLRSVHHDKKIFEEPEIFKPERHLDGAGNFVKSKYVIPFSIGPRRCVGEQLARMEVFIYIVSLVQKFNFQSHGDVPSLSSGLDENFYVPPAYQVIATER